VVRGVLIAVLACLLFGGGTWLMFASTVFAITDVSVDGATSTVAASLRSAVDDVLGQRRLGFLQPARNILLLDASAMAASLQGSFPGIESLEVVKEYPHAVRIVARERVPIGAWCVGESCQYFDRSGARWGTAVPSRGPLLLLVRDERSDAAWDPRLFAGLMAVADGLPDMGVRPITLTFPDTAPGDMRVSVAAGYDVVFDALGNIQDQLATLRVLITDRAGDPGFRPAYIDTRTPGRVYYK
jgi:cell division protein FtsQ